MTNIENPFKKKMEEVSSQVETPKEETPLAVDPPVTEKPSLLKRDRNRPPAEDAHQEIPIVKEEETIKPKTLSIPVFKPKPVITQKPVVPISEPIIHIPEIVETIDVTEDPIILSDSDESDDLSDYESLLEDTQKTPQNEPQSQTEVFHDDSAITANFLDEEEEIPLPKSNAFSIKDRTHVPNQRIREDSIAEINESAAVSEKPVASNLSNISKQFGKKQVVAPKSFSDAIKKTQSKVEADAALKEVQREKIEAEQKIIAKAQKQSKIASIFKKVILPSVTAIAIIVGSGLAYLGYQDVSTENFARVDAIVTKVNDTAAGCEITYTYKGKFTQYEGIEVQNNSCGVSDLQEEAVTSVFFREDQEDSGTMNEPVEGAGWMNVYVGGGIAILGFIIGGSLVISSVRRMNQMKKNEKALKSFNGNSEENEMVGAE